MTLQNKSMLVELTISKWTATRHDKHVSAEVEQKHSATDAGRYNKRLIDKAHLAEIDTLAGQVRLYHYSRTLPWSDKGQRLLPSALFMEYRQEIALFKTRFEAAVGAFLALYPQLVGEARRRLNTLFQADDYPDVADLRQKFAIDTEFMPVPDAADFRVEVAQETQDELREQITAAVTSRQAATVRDCWARTKAVVERIGEQCGKEGGRIYDSSIENARELVELLAGLNITGDPQIAAIEQEIRAQLLVPAEQLRTSPTTRRRVADAASAILGQMP